MATLRRDIAIGGDRRVYLLGARKKASWRVLLIAFSMAVFALRPCLGEKAALGPDVPPTVGDDGGLSMLHRRRPALPGVRLRRRAAICASRADHRYNHEQIGVKWSADGFWPAPPALAICHLFGRANGMVSQPDHHRLSFI